KRLVLCFDGTANKFTGDETDTNIVQIYTMLDRQSPSQYHYYQPEIGSYVSGHISNTKRNPFTQATNWCIERYDEAFGYSFVHHVLAGYKFLMRFYTPGDKIYIFGFSRGAYTARFLAEMIHKIGLLSEGNEEMIRFAWDMFSDFQTKRGDRVESDLISFKIAFCRKAVKVEFLGLFDCVNSVARLQDGSSSDAGQVARHVRHAVSLGERRIAFKPALFGWDKRVESDDGTETMEEMYFAGNHGDVGGGWGYAKEKAVEKVSLFQISLQWMVDEVVQL
ncbi:uncharacterized protein LY89DRAFT_558466, partial [Mollisia scopiformis]